MKILKENLLRNIGVGRKKLIEDWLATHKHERYRIENDFSITIEAPGGMTINYTDFDELPEYILFSNRNKHVTIYGDRIKSFRGIPDDVKSFLIISDNMKTLPPLKLNVTNYFRITAPEVTKIESLDITSPYGIRLYIHTDVSSLDDVKCSNASQLIIDDSVLGRKISSIVRSAPLSTPSELNPIPEDQALKVEKLLGNINIDNLKEIRYNQTSKLTKEHISGLQRIWIKKSIKQNQVDIVSIYREKL